MKLERKRLERDALDGTVGPPTEPAMTNTPHRRNVLKRAEMNTTILDLLHLHQRNLLLAMSLKEE